MQRTKTKPFSKEEYESLYGRVPRLCVDLVIQTDQGIVLTKRSIPPAKGKWHIPGSTLVLGETIEQCAHRVAREELNIEIEIEKFIGVIEYGGEDAFGQSISVVFLAHITGGALEKDDDAEELRAFHEFPDTLIQEQKVFLEKFRKTQTPTYVTR